MRVDLAAPVDIDRVEDEIRECVAGAD